MPDDEASSRAGPYASMRLTSIVDKELTKLVDVTLRVRASSCLMTKPYEVGTSTGSTSEMTNYSRVAWHVQELVYCLPVMSV